MADITLKGNCYLCGKTLSKAAFKNHLLSQHTYGDADGQDCAILRIEGAEDTNYWLYLDIALTSTLKSLDDFLRKIWLECCGHMSAFYGKGYEGIGKSTLIGEFSVGRVLKYEYDFGSTTSLKITVVAHARRPKQRKAVRLLGRNESYTFLCTHCGKPAELICCKCLWENIPPYLCEECASEHRHDIMLPVTNSPRMGVCGYRGDLDVYGFDPAKIEAKST